MGVLINSDVLALLSSPSGKAPKGDCQPTRKQVCDLIRILLLASLLNMPAKEHKHTLLLLLEVDTHIHTHGELPK